MMQPDLFATSPSDIRRPGLTVLRGFALAEAEAILSDIEGVVDRAPFRFMRVPGGGKLSVAMTNCGSAGWITDAKGYRYSASDPQTGTAWPAMPDRLYALADRAALTSGFGSFNPDACLINRYEPGAKMGLHQDRDERDFAAPIVSVSFGLPANFLFGGLNRKDRVETIRMLHGDVAVWGGELRKAYHGVGPVKAAPHPLLDRIGQTRLNLTFRRAL